MAALQECQHDVINALLECCDDVSKNDLADVLHFVQNALETTISKRASVAELLSMRLLQ